MSKQYRLQLIVKEVDNEDPNLKPKTVGFLLAQNFLV